jgi:hypothetical protein
MYGRGDECSEQVAYHCCLDFVGRRMRVDDYGCYAIPRRERINTTAELEETRGERTHFDDRDQAFYTRVRQGFLEFGSRINALPAGNRVAAVIVDAHPPADEVEAAVVRDLF